MTWLHQYRLRHYLRNSIWVYPVMSMFVGILLGRVLMRWEEESGWVGTRDPDSVRAVLGMLAGSIFTFIVFVCSSLLLVVQLASAQLTPRMIGLLFEDWVTKITLALFVFVFSFSLTVLIRVGNIAPPLSANIAGWSAAACICLFIFLIDHIGKLLRPSGALRTVAARGHRVIDAVYPRRLKDAKPASGGPATLSGKAPTRTVVSRQNGVVLAFDVRGIVALAARHSCTVELIPQVGHFVAPGDPLFQIYDATDFPADRLLQSIAIGVERTLEQDPAFALRVVVDIAAKGLSPAINDPTTAVLAIDQLHHLLRHIGKRQLDDEKVRDRNGHFRLMYRTPNWEDFVTLGVTEIRHFGGSSIQITRRLRGMLENLIKTLPDERSAPLRHELQLLNKSAERFFPEPHDRAMAGVSDFLGVGGTGEPDDTKKTAMP